MHLDKLWPQEHENKKPQVLHVAVRYYGASGYMFVCMCVCKFFFIHSMGDIFKYFNDFVCPFWGA